MGCEAESEIAMNEQVTIEPRSRRRIAWLSILLFAAMC